MTEESPSGESGRSGTPESGESGPRRAARPDSAGIGQQVRSVSFLLLACGILWTIASYGPDGGEWISYQTASLLGVRDAGGPILPEGDRAPAEPRAQQSEMAAMSGSGFPVDHVRRVILDALGGDERVEVRHIAFSDDGEAMVAAVIFRDPDGTARPEEILFAKDQFGRYVSEGDAPIERTIKIWKLE